MCGIAGFLQAPRSSSIDLEDVASKMALTLAHRGPDHQGLWGDASAGIALAHRRLAIVDLTPEGEQPMVSDDGRYVVVFNGEVYNHLELRAELERMGHPFRGRSDTEVLLAAIGRWGLPGALSRSNGMLALAVWDRVERVLHLARDRFGEKPLYYGWFGDTFLFASELKAFRAHPAFAARVDPEGLGLYLRHLCVPAPFSILAGVRKLLPGTFLTVSLARRDASPAPFFSALDLAERGRAHPFDGSEGDAVDALDRALTRSVDLRMMADVPLGAFLSGGIDSSLIVALMQKLSSRRVKTFCIGVGDATYDEAPFARAVAAHLGTDHTEVYVTPEEALAVVPDLPRIYDEPFADSSQIPTTLVSRVARRHVAVAMSGDGGDELFGGYPKYRSIPRMWRQLSSVPAPVRALVAAGLTRPSERSWDRVLTPLGRLLPSRFRRRAAGAELRKLATVLRVEGFEQLHAHLAAQIKDPRGIARRSAAPDVLGDPRLQDRDLRARLMYLDLVSYLPDDLLVKVDRASMSIALETRLPMLDPDVVALAWALPMSLKIRGDRTKVALREVLARYVPRPLFERPKGGFSIPIGVWLRGPLREWAEDLLDETSIRRDGFFDPLEVRRLWQHHLAAGDHWNHHVWILLMFQAWLREFGSPALSAAA